MRHIIIIFALLCAACNAKLPSIKPFKMDIQQGNVVTSKMMLQLKPGMTKSQVRYIMGTPLIQDGFHPDRWDYFYQMRKGGEIIEQRRVIMEFENDALVRIRGDVIPAGSGQTVAEPEPVTPAKPKKAESKKSLLDRLQFWKDDEEETQPQSAPPELVAPAAKPNQARPAPVPEAQPAETAPVQPLPATQAEEAAPASESTQAEDEVVQPAPVPVAPAAAPEPAVESPAIEDSVVPAEAMPAAPAAPQSKPAADAPVKEPVEAPAGTSVEKSAGKPIAKPAAEARQPAQATETKPAPESQADDELPPEDAPGYFERMLEKIGF